MLRYRCNKCGEALESPKSLVGMMQKCPACGGRYFAIPEGPDVITQKLVILEPRGLHIRPMRAWWRDELLDVACEMVLSGHRADRGAFAVDPRSVLGMASYTFGLRVGTVLTLHCRGSGAEEARRVLVEGCIYCTWEARCGDFDEFRRGFAPQVGLDPGEKDQIDNALAMAVYAEKVEAGERRFSCRGMDRPVAAYCEGCCAWAPL